MTKRPAYLGEWMATDLLYTWRFGHIIVDIIPMELTGTILADLFEPFYVHM